MAANALCLVGLCMFDELCGHSAPKLVRSNLGVLKNEGSCCHYSSLTYVAVVEECCSHAYERAVVDGAGMHCGIVSYGYVVAYHCWTCGVGDVYAGSVLHVGAVANGDWGDIASYHGVEPY